MRKLENENQCLKDEIVGLQNVIMGLKKEKGSLKGQNWHLKKTIEDLKSEISQLNEDISELNEKLKTKAICIICSDNDVCIVFIPCMHSACCAECNEKLKRTHSEYNCPLCKGRIEKAIPIFIP